MTGPRRWAPPVFLGISAALLGAFLVLSWSIGAAPLDLRTAWSDPESIDRLILVRERIPRSLLGAMVGAALSVSGLVFQAVLANPLADPYVIGVAGGAALGGALVLAVPLAAALGQPAVSLGAFAGGLLAIALNWTLSRGRRGTLRAYHFLLVGVVLNAVASAAVMFLKTVVRAEKAQEMLLWLMGTLATDVRSPSALLMVFALLALAGLWLYRLAPALNALTLGAEGASVLGVDPVRTTRQVFLAGSLLVAAAVSVSGLIGFVGLIVPHAVRRVIGSDHRWTLPACACSGAAFLVLADWGVRALFPVFHTESPVGVLTALVGGPAFVWLLHRTEEAP